MHADYTGQGFDQLLDVIDKIKNNPDDRRIIMSAWNPSDLKLMALPPCHMFAQVIPLYFLTLLFRYNEFDFFLTLFFAVLCGRRGTLVSNVSAFSRHGPWCAV